MAALNQINRGEKRKKHETKDTNIKWQNEKASTMSNETAKRCIEFFRQHFLLVPLFIC